MGLFEALGLLLAKVSRSEILGSSRVSLGSRTHQLRSFGWEQGLFPISSLVSGSLTGIAETKLVVLLL